MKNNAQFITIANCGQLEWALNNFALEICALFFTKINMYFCLPYKIYNQQEENSGHLHSFHTWIKLNYHEFLFKKITAFLFFPITKGLKNTSFLPGFTGWGK